MTRLPRRPFNRLTPAGGRALGAAVVVLAAAGAALATGGPWSGGQVASLAAGGQTRATLRVTSGTPLLDIRVAAHGGPLVQAQTPFGASVRPELKETGGPKGTEVDLSLASGGGSGRGSGPVTVTLNPDVTWALVFAGGTQRTVADLRGGRVAVLVFTAGSSVIDVTLPRPRGRVPLILAGGAGRLQVRVPAGVPARVTAGGGAGEVTLDGATSTGVAGGTVLASAGWRAAGPQVDIDAASGAAQIAVTRWRRLSAGHHSIRLHNPQTLYAERIIVTAGVTGVSPVLSAVSREHDGDARAARGGRTGGRTACPRHGPGPAHRRDSMPGLRPERAGSPPDAGDRPP